MDKILLKIKRQNHPDANSYWEEFKIFSTPRMSLISALKEIQQNPVNAKGQAAPAIAWEANCLEELCGSCTMIINGRLAQACSTFVDELEQPITLEPLTKFPVKRDLVVDRSRLFEDSKKVKPWISIDGVNTTGRNVKMSPNERAQAYELAACIHCGACQEVCPQYHRGSPYVGAAILSQSRLYHEHPASSFDRGERLDALMEPGGVDDCGNAQNCVKACPKGIPLTTSISKMKREATKHGIGKFFGK